MKRIFKILIISKLIALVLFSNLAIALSATDTTEDTENSLEQRLLGTWRWETQHSWVIIFREDGTMLDGTPGMRTTHSWRIVNGRLHVDSEDWNLRINEDTITVDRLGDTFTYIWYSDSTEGETSYWGILIILGIVIIIISGVIITIVLVIKRRSRRKTQQTSSQYAAQRSPYNAYCYNCNLWISSNDEYCKQCGSALSKVQSVSASTISPEQDIGLQHHTPPSSNDVLYADKKKENDFIYIDDVLKKQIIEIYKQGEKVDSLYMFEDIPSQKLQNAIVNFASTISNDETAIILYDETVSGTCEEGILLTSQRIYCKGDVASISSIDNLKVQYNMFKNARIIIEMNARSDITIHTMLFTKQGEALFTLLNQTIQMLKDRQGI